MGGAAPLTINERRTAVCTAELADTAKLGQAFAEKRREQKPAPYMFADVLRRQRKLAKSTNLQIYCPERDSNPHGLAATDT